MAKTLQNLDLAMSMIIRRWGQVIISRIQRRELTRKTPKCLGKQQRSEIQNVVSNSTAQHPEAVLQYRLVESRRNATDAVEPSPNPVD